MNASPLRTGKESHENDESRRPPLPASRLGQKGPSTIENMVMVLAAMGGNWNKLCKIDVPLNYL